MKQVVVKPKPKIVNTGFTMRQNMVDFLDDEAERLGINKSELVRLIVEQYMEAVTDAPAA